MSGTVVVPATTAAGGAARSRERADPCTMVLFGATGDLSRRKLLPALYHLARERLLDPRFALLGVAREPMDDEAFRALVRDAVVASLDEGEALDGAAWAPLAERTHYVAGDFAEGATYLDLAERLTALEEDREPATRNRFFYLAVPPSIFGTIVDHLAASGIAPRQESPEAEPWARIVVEKPFGHSLETARALSARVLAGFGEHQVYRIDHYLGKETVQNILVLRFANAIFEPVWNRQWIAQVQITVAEDVGVGGRAGYYEEAGVVRDMFQNHLLQLLALTAMEPPVSMAADAVRDEKVKVLRAIRWVDRDACQDDAVLAQYAAGEARGERVPGYRGERGVAAGSRTPTYAAMRLLVDNWRWSGVPFYLRSGKRMAGRVSEIAVQFRLPPALMFAHETGEAMEPNVLRLRVQPDEGVALRFEAKIPGVALALTREVEVAPVEARFSYAEAFDRRTPPAYETLLLDVMIGEATLFTRTDEVEHAWRVIEPLLACWERDSSLPVVSYPAGSWGPAEADALLARDGFRWLTPPAAR